MSAAADRRPGRPRDARVDQQVMDATLAEIADKGIGNITIEGIAATAGVGKATIYRRWSNRDDLLRFVAAQLTDTCEAPDTGDLRRDLLGVFEPLAEQFYDGGRAVLLPDFCAQAAHDDTVRTMVRDLAQQRRAGAIQAFERARRRGELRKGVDIEAVVDMLAGCLLYRFLIMGQPLGGTLAETIVDTALDGVRK